MRLLALVLIPFALFAQLGADRAATNRVYQTGEIVNEAWMKHIVTEYIGEDGPPELRDRMGKFMSAANLAALGVAAENACAEKAAPEPVTLKTAEQPEPFVKSVEAEADVAVEANEYIGTATKQGDFTEEDFE